MSVFRNGIRTTKSGKRQFNREFRVAVLESLEKTSSEDATCLEFHITKQELKRIISWKGHLSRVASRKALVKAEAGVRERLFEKAMLGAESSLVPLEKIAQSKLVQEDPKILPHAINHLKNRGLIAVKVLEGLGDFRKGGDDVPREGPRQPMFILPEGAEVSVSLDIRTKGDRDGSRRKETVIEAERMEPALQEG